MYNYDYNKYVIIDNVRVTCNPLISRTVWTISCCNVAR